MKYAKTYTKKEEGKWGTLRAHECLKNHKESKVRGQ